MLMKQWSSRRADIEDRVALLTHQFTEDRARPPTDKESIALAQRANLQTREATHDPRSEAEQRQGWNNQAADLLSDHGIRVLIASAISSAPRSRQQFAYACLAHTADTVHGQIQSHRATTPPWQNHPDTNP